MPAMPRPSKKASRIAYTILGIPSSFQTFKSKKKKEMMERLRFEDNKQTVYF